MLVVYLALIVDQGDVGFFAILPWALLMAVAVALAFSAAWASDPRIRRNLLVGAASVYAVIGVVSLLTIGVLFIAAAAIAAIGAARLSGQGAD